MSTSPAFNMLLTSVSFLDRDADFPSIYSFSATVLNSGGGVHVTMPSCLGLGTYLKKSSGGFDAKSVTQKRILSRVGLSKLGKERSKEYCRLAKPTTALKLRTTYQVQLLSCCSSYRACSVLTILLGLPAAHACCAR